MAAAPARDPRRRHTRDAAFDGEAVALEQRRQITLRLELLVADLAEAEEAVDDLLRQRPPLLDFGDGGALQRREPCVELGRAARLSVSGRDDEQA